MKKKCKNGHFFDYRLDYCPICQHEGLGDVKGVVINDNGVITSKKVFSSKNRKDDFATEPLVNKSNTKGRKSDNSNYFDSNPIVRRKVRSSASNGDVTEPIRPGSKNSFNINNKIKSDAQRSSHGQIKPSDNKQLTGFLVCLSGQDLGSFIPVYRSESYLTDIANKKVMQSNKMSKSLLRIEFDERTRYHVCEVLQGTLRVNGMIMQGKFSLHTGDRIALDNTYEFLSFCEGIDKWGCL